MLLIIDVALTTEGEQMAVNDVCEKVFDILSAASDDTVIAAVTLVEPHR